MNKNFDVEFLNEAQLFIENLGEKERRKIFYNIRKAQYINDKEIFKKLNDHIWEFRTIYNSTSFRLFAFWDKSKNNTVVISTHGILKKTQKIPERAIQKAEKMREEYFKYKDEKRN